MQTGIISQGEVRKLAKDGGCVFQSLSDVEGSPEPGSIGPWELNATYA